MKKITKKILKGIVERGGYALSLDTDVDGVVCGFKTDKFKSRTVKGECSHFFDSNIKRPIIGKNYKVRCGDPESFVGKYLGKVALHRRVRRFIERIVDGEPEYYYGILEDDVFVFKQGKNEYLFYDAFYTQFIEEA